MAHHVLIIEDETTLAGNIARFLRKRDYEVEVAGTGEAGLQALGRFGPDVILLDFNLPGRNGLDILARIREYDSGAKVIMMTGQGSAKLAVETMKAGAWDYLTKPLVLAETLLLIDRAIGDERIASALAYYRRRDAGEGGLGKIIGESPAVERLRERIRQVLDVEHSLSEGPPPTVLITGETGTGKELVARALHFDSLRADEPFIVTNCAALPASMVEAELFGYEKGAFTDAAERKIGLVEAAHGGTLFLDEIGDLEPGAQAKVLRLLEDRTVRRLGGIRDRQVDVRLIAATNADLASLITQGRFRADLLYRIQVISIATPPLRERGGDAMILAQHFLDSLARRYGRTGLAFAPSVAGAIRAGSWPGNVRQLRNAVEQAVLMVRTDTIEPADLLPASGTLTAPDDNHVSGARAGLSGLLESGMTLAQVEREFVSMALRAEDGNVTRCARRLGISRDTLRYRISKYGLGGENA